MMKASMKSLMENPLFQSSSEIVNIWMTNDFFCEVILTFKLKV